MREDLETAVTGVKDAHRSALPQILVDVASPFRTATASVTEAIGSVAAVVTTATENRPATAQQGAAATGPLVQ